MKKVSRIVQGFQDVACHHDHKVDRVLVWKKRNWYVVKIVIFNVKYLSQHNFIIVQSLPYRPNLKIVCFIFNFKENDDNTMSFHSY